MTWELEHGIFLKILDIATWTLALLLVIDKIVHAVGKVTKSIIKFLVEVGSAHELREKVEEKHTTQKEVNPTSSYPMEGQSL